MACARGTGPEVFTVLALVPHSGVRHSQSSTTGAWPPARIPESGSYCRRIFLQTPTSRRNLSRRTRLRDRHPVEGHSHLGSLRYFLTLAVRFPSAGFDKREHPPTSSSLSSVAQSFYDPLGESTLRL